MNLWYKHKFTGIKNKLLDKWQFNSNRISMSVPNFMVIHQIWALNLMLALEEIGGDHQSCIKCHGDLSNSCWNISAWIKVVVHWQSNISISRSLLLLCLQWNYFLCMHSWERLNHAELHLKKRNLQSRHPVITFIGFGKKQTKFLSSS